MMKFEENKLLLRKTINAYNNLRGNCFEYTLGRKGETTKLKVIFVPSDFHHLAGFQYLLDIPFLKRNKRMVLFQLKEEKYFNAVCNSNNFTKIIGRLRSIIFLEQHLLNKENIIFKFVRIPSGTQLNFKYLMEIKVFNETTYFFIDERLEEEQLKDYLVGKSIFLKSNRDFSTNQQRMTILEINVKELNF